MRRRQLGIELRRLRKEAGVTAEAAAKWVGMTAPTINKIENGRQVIRIGHLRALCQLYGVEAPLVDNLAAQSAEASKRGWWVAYGDLVPDWFRDYVGLEGGSAEICAYEAGLINGLLQTSAYTHALARAARPDATEDDLQRSATFRAERQARLASDTPPILRVVLDEAALSRPVGGREVMREQLAHLRETSHLENVDVRMLPFSAGEHPSMGTSFTLLRWTDDVADVVYQENDRGSLYLERPSDIARYAQIFRELHDRALSGGKFRAALDRLAEHL